MLIRNIFSCSDLNYVQDHDQYRKVLRSCVRLFSLRSAMTVWVLAACGHSIGSFVYSLFNELSVVQTVLRRRT